MSKLCKHHCDVHWCCIFVLSILILESSKFFITLSWFQPLTFACKSKCDTPRYMMWPPQVYYVNYVANILHIPNWKVGCQNKVNVSFYNCIVQHPVLRIEVQFLYKLSGCVLYNSDPSGQFFVWHPHMCWDRCDPAWSWCHQVSLMWHTQLSRQVM